MFGSSKPIPFDPYGRRRSSRRFPPWLALLVIGIALGIGAVLVVQERYLPPRLSAAESIRLRDDYQAADAERTGLKRELADTTARNWQKATRPTARPPSTTSRPVSPAPSRCATTWPPCSRSLPPDPRGEARCRCAPVASRATATVRSTTTSS